MKEQFLQIVAGSHVVRLARELVEPHVASLSRDATVARIQHARRQTPTCDPATI